MSTNTNFSPRLKNTVTESLLLHFSVVSSKQPKHSICKCAVTSCWSCVTSELLWQGVLSSQPLSVTGSSTVTVPGQQLAGLLRPVTATSRSLHIGSVPSTLPGVQFISKPLQILQCSATSTAQLLPAVSAINQVDVVANIQIRPSGWPRTRVVNAFIVLYWFIATDFLWHQPLYPYNSLMMLEILVIFTVARFGFSRPILHLPCSS